jgi:hypothetical protein
LREAIERGYLEAEQQADPAAAVEAVDPMTHRAGA